MADAKVEIKGINQLVRTMRKAGVDIQDLKKANKAAGVIVATAGKAVVPRLTGALGSSIRPGQAARKAVVRAGGARIRYARFQEFGSSKNAAQHYLYGSAERTQPEWLAAYEWDLAGIIGKIQGQ
jgi:ribosomal protein S12 methylthiotransferase accessory factor YcaO